MTLTEQVVKNIIKRLLNAQDYRIEIVGLINAEFLQFAIDFFKKVAYAKLDNKSITTDWYKNTFLNPNLSSDEICINSGLNKLNSLNISWVELRNPNSFKLFEKVLKDLEIPHKSFDGKLNDKLEEIFTQIF